MRERGPVGYQPTNPVMPFAARLTQDDARLEFLLGKLFKFNFKVNNQLARTINFIMRVRIFRRKIRDTRHAHRPLTVKPAKLHFACLTL